MWVSLDIRFPHRSGIIDFSLVNYQFVTLQTTFAKHVFLVVKFLSLFLWSASVSLKCLAANGGPALQSTLRKEQLLPRGRVSEPMHRPLRARQDSRPKGTGARSGAKSPLPAQERRLSSQPRETEGGLSLGC